jgi:hypothetical protein
MMAVDHYMAWNMAGYFKLVHGDWEDAERMSSPRVHRHSRRKIYRHRPREWQLEGTDKHPELVPYDLRPVDPRMSAEERSWATWDGESCARRPYHLRVGRRHGASHKAGSAFKRTVGTYQEWLAEREEELDDHNSV